MPYPQVPTKNATPKKRLFFIEDELDTIHELLHVLSNSISSIPEEHYHCNCWLVNEIQDKLEVVNKQAFEVRKEVLRGEK